jgi:hypothetical protein
MATKHQKIYLFTECFFLKREKEEKQKKITVATEQTKMDF